MPWLQLSLTADKERAPAIETLFEALGALSVTYGDAADQPLLEPAPGETRLWNHTCLTALFDADAKDPKVETLTRLLHDQAVITSGAKLEDPAAFAARLNEALSG